MTEAESLVQSGVRLARAGDGEAAVEELLRAREKYCLLAETTDDDDLRFFALRRRVRSRVDRIVRAIRGEGSIEFFDVLDARGAKTGRRVPSTLAHLNGTRHSSIEVIFFDPAGRMLLQLRAPEVAIFPDRWTYAATGHLSSGETSREAACNEIVEEIAAPILNEEDRALAEPFADRLQTEDGRPWLRFTPKDKNLMQLGRENEYAGSLRLIEFIYLSPREKASLLGAIEPWMAGQDEEGIDRLLEYVEPDGRTISLFTFSEAQNDRLDRAAQSVQDTGSIPWGAFTHNVEMKNLYIYRIDVEEMPLLEAVIALKAKAKEDSKASRTSGSSLTAGFDWVDFEQTVADFNRHPERYTDGFVPFFADPEIVELIRAHRAR